MRDRRARMSGHRAYVWRVERLDEGTQSRFRALTCVIHDAGGTYSYRATGLELGVRRRLPPAPLA